MTASRQPAISLGRKLGAVLCLLLLIGFSTAVLVHTHPQNSPESSAHCQLCFAAHAPVASAAPLAVAPQVISRPAPPPVPALLATRTVFFDLNIRPPPAS
jgi:hypothetical protein